MDALTMYKNLLRELDKFNSPTFTIKDYNYFISVAVSKYITDNYGDFDVIQKDLDDIKDLLVYKSTLTFTGFEATLPEGYRHSLGVSLDVTFIIDTLDNAVDDVDVLYPKRLQTNRKGYTHKNAYQQPSVEYPTYQLSGDSIIVTIGDEVAITEFMLDYIKTPDEIYLNPDTDADYTNIDNNTASQFSKYVNFEIIKLCRQIFLENIESPRYQTTLNENQVTKNKE